MAQGLDSLRQGRSEEARLLFAKALQAEPNLASAHFQLGLLDRRQDRLRDALEHFRVAAAAEQPDYLRAFARTQLQLYLEHPASTAFQQQTELLSRKLRNVPTLADEGFRLAGYLAVMERKPEEAIQAFRQAWVRNPKLEDVGLALLQQLLAAGQDADAQAWLEEQWGKSSLGPALLETFYLHVLQKEGCRAAGAFLEEKLNSPGVELWTRQFQLASHKRRCEGAAAEEAYLSGLRNKSDLQYAEAIRLGDYYSEQANWEQALAAYDRAASLPPTRSSPQEGSLELRRSSALIGLRRMGEAARILDQYLQQHPQDANALAQRGLLRLHGNLPGANAAFGLKDLREALAQGEARILPSLRLQYAMNLLRLGQLAEARREMQILAQTMPGALALRVLQAEFQLRDGKPQAAEKSCREILLEAPNLREARLIQATSLWAMGQAPDALVLLRKLAAEYPEDESVAVQLLGVLAENPNPAEKAEFLSLLAKLESNENLSTPAQFVLAELLRKRGDYEKASTRLDRLARERSDTRARLRLNEIRLLEGKAAQACQDIAALAPQEPDMIATNRVTWWGLRAICLEQAKDSPDALAAHRRALDLAPGDPVLSNNLASALADLGQNLDEALRLAKLAVSSRPDEVQYLDTLGWVYYQRKELGEARSIFQQLRKKGALPAAVEAHASVLLGPPSTVTR